MSTITGEGVEWKGHQHHLHNCQGKQVKAGEVNMASLLSPPTPNLK